MKKNLALLIVTVAGTLFANAESGTNRLTFSARFGFDIKAKFKSVNALSAPVNLRRTPSQPGRPDGDAYNYDDGYVLTDFSGNFGGETTYWGYDNSSSQISGDSILLSRSSASGSFPSRSMREDPALGAEIVYSRQLCAPGNVRYGFEAALNYMNLSLDGRSAVAATETRTTDAYPFTPGTTPPTATPSDPYQGTFMGPGFVIGDTPISSTTTIVSGATAIDRRRLDSDIWGFRLGPYAEFPITEAVNFQISGGLAGALLDTEVAWSISGTTLYGRGQDYTFRFGGYLAANLSWQLNESWSAVVGAQYQNLGRYQHSFDGRKVELDLHHSLFVTAGFGCSF
jgi:hypothetical protein